MQRLRSLSRQLHTDRVAWTIIITLMVAYLFPYLVTGSELLNVPAYSPVGFIPLITAAYLRERRGSFIVWCIIQFATLLFCFHSYGLLWPTVLIVNFMIGNLIALVLGQSIGYFFYMNRRLARANAMIQQQALTDGLTGLPNHRNLIEQLTKVWEQAQRTGTSFSLIFFDGDRFKQVNDTYGHAIGDAVLRELGQRASSVLRTNDILGRMGGEEFVVILPETDNDIACKIAERLRLAVSSFPLVTEHVMGGLPVTVSIGVASYPRDASSAPELLKQADEAMYWAKRLGRNQVRNAVEVADLAQIVPTEALPESRSPQSTIYTQDVITLLSHLLAPTEDLMRQQQQLVALATRVAQKLALTEDEIPVLVQACQLRDLGLLSIDQLHVSISDHAVRGAELINHLPGLTTLASIIRTHHECWDGQGHPDHLAGADIPLAARIIAVAEAYLALTNATCASNFSAIDIIRGQAGTHFDPAVVSALEQVVASELLSV